MKPYLIVAPSYTEKSAGAKVLHVLCDALNKVGQKAYICPMGDITFNPYLDTPTYKGDEEPIVVYPEIIQGNPLNSKYVVRYLLYYAGVYAGQGALPQEGDKVWSYSTRIARRWGNDKVLFLPVSDPEIFYPGDEERSGVCYYAHKYRSFYKGTPHTEGFEITTDYPKTKPELAKLLRSCKKFIAYEDTALIFEARMCGCEVELAYDEHFTECHTLEDFPLDADYNFYLECQKNFWKQLDEFIEDTQEW